LRVKGILTNKRVESSLNNFDEVLISC